MDAPPSSATERDPALDALRAAMMGLGIVLHAAMLYAAAPPAAMALPTDRNNSPLLDALFSWIHSFRMPLFFMLSGWFSSQMLNRRGLRLTLLNRWRRIGLPLLLSMVTVLPLTGWMLLAFWLGAHGGPLTLLPERAAVEGLIADLRARGTPAGEPSWLHLWFLWYLCLFCLVLLPAAAWLHRLLGSALERVGVWRSPWRQALLLTLLLAGPLWFFRGGQVNEGFMFMRPHVPSLLYFGVFFALGMLAQRQADAFSSLGRRLGLRSLVALTLFLVASTLARQDDAAAGTSPGLHAASVLLNGLNSALWIGVLLGGTLRWVRTPGPWITYLSRASFWVYLVHLPLVGLVGWWLLRFDLPALLKFSWVCAFTLAFALWSYHHLVQSSWVSVLLNGQRFRMAWPWRQR